MVETVTAVVFANALTFWFLFGLWRVSRNERDTWGYAHVLGALCVIGLFGFADLQSRGSPQAETAQASQGQKPAAREATR